ncbi:putative reverse transcriptase zinc-binding domain-containing protein [Helianthus annuus]|nr:putative reverse transcriptase zinc-binding domain-containing protein [Helianthus annuus]
MWRLFLDRLPTKKALIRRNLQVGNPLCEWCEIQEESAEHLFTGCGFSAGVWNGVSRWCRIPDIYAFHIKDLVGLHDTCGTTGTKKMVLQGVIIIACWVLWKARNEKIFSNKHSKVVEVVTDIKVLAFFGRNIDSKTV